MKYEIVTIPKKIIVGKAIKTTNEENKAVNDIGTLWQEFIGNGIHNSVNNKINQMAIGLYTEYKEDYTKEYTFMCGCEVFEVDNTEKLSTKIIPSGKYAKFTISGHMITAVCQAWSEIWEMNLDRKYTSDFEVYHNDSEDMNNQTIDIYISIN